MHASKYLEELYLGGEDLSVGNYVVAAVNYHRPDLRGAVNLPRTHQSLKGWRTLCPPRSRMPIPYEVICLLAREALLKGKIEICLVLLLNFFCYLRPTEFEKIRVCDIVAPVGGVS